MRGRGSPHVGKGGGDLNPGASASHCRAGKLAGAAQAAGRGQWELHHIPPCTWLLQARSVLLPVVGADDDALRVGRTHHT